jgi:hypothetical protein
MDERPGCDRILFLICSYRDDIHRSSWLTGASTGRCVDGPGCGSCVSGHPPAARVAPGANRGRDAAWRQSCPLTGDDVSRRRTRQQGPASVWPSAAAEHREVRGRRSQGWPAGCASCATRPGVTTLATGPRSQAGRIVSVLCSPSSKGSRRAEEAAQPPLRNRHAGSGRARRGGIHACRRFAQSLPRFAPFCPGGLCRNMQIATRSKVTPWAG